MIHRDDMYLSLLHAAQQTQRIEIATSPCIQRVKQTDDHSVTAVGTKGNVPRGGTLIGADGVKSAVRRQYVGDEARVSGHVVYRAVVEREDFPADLR